MRKREDFLLLQCILCRVQTAWSLVMCQWCAGLLQQSVKKDGDRYGEEALSTLWD